MGSLELVEKVDAERLELDVIYTACAKHELYKLFTLSRGVR